MVSCVYFKMCLSGAQMEIASNREGYACDFCFYRTTQQEGFDFRWADVFYVWKIYLIFFIPFLIHNFFIAPLLIYRHRSGLFFLLQTTLLAIFFATQHAIKEQGNTGKKMENASSTPINIPQHFFSRPTSSILSSCF